MRPLAGMWASSCDAVSSTNVVIRNMGNSFGSSQQLEEWKSWCVTDRYSLPGTAVLVKRRDQDSSNSSSLENRSFGPDELPGHGEGNLENSFDPVSQMQGKPSWKTGDPWSLWQAPDGSRT